MAMAIGDPPPLEEPPKARYVDALNPSPHKATRKGKLEVLKTISYVHGEPCLLWEEEEELDEMIIEEQLQYAIGECKMGFLSNKIPTYLTNPNGVLIQPLSKPAFYLKAKNGYHQM
ncbi:hypothetical protein HAX54_020713 [Datura stramonium]|uniref:Uncharacterized protein n=1 Tax=Datura stramonium TaxID=4076 RepID=A0ABS8UTR9_DATST|nr:hypothetical protein [Datura stramonium]